MTVAMWQPVHTIATGKMTEQEDWSPPQSMEKKPGCLESVTEILHRVYQHLTTYKAHTDQVRDCLNPGLTHKKEGIARMWQKR